MPEQISLRQDRHVHSRFSDGEGTLAQNIAAAEALGLQALTCVDHVRVSTDWVPPDLSVQVPSLEDALVDLLERTSADDVVPRDDRAHLETIGANR